MLNLAAAQDYDAFFEQEIAYRKLGLYPPFCGLCVIGFAGAKEIEVARAAARFAALLGQQAAKQPDLPLRVLGPTPGSIEKINDTYRYKLTIKCRNDRRFRDLVRSTLEDTNRKNFRPRPPLRWTCTRTVTSDLEVP